MKKEIRLQEDKEHFEYVEAEITLKLRVYTEQEDLRPYVTEMEAIRRVKNHLYNLEQDNIIPSDFAYPISIKIIE